MRIIHTSDWHLGQNFYSKSRAAEHSAFLDWLLTSAQAHEVDAIIVAGDIFDTGSPPSYARELYNRFVVQLQQTGCQLVVLAGNHDSVATLNESRDILAFLENHGGGQRRPCSLYSAAARRHARRHILPGPLPAPARAGHQPGRTLRRRKTAAAVERYQRLLSAAVRSRLRPARRSSAADRRQRPPDHRWRQQERCGARYLHRHAGGVPRQPFSPVDYVALGHIHRAQKIGGSDHIRYSGSPIALSFDETGKSKSVNLVTFSDGHLAEVLPLTVPVTQPLAVLKGDFSSISEQLTRWRDAPQEPVVWLDIEITSDEYLHDIQRKIQAQTEDLPVEVLLVRRSRAQRERILAGERRRR